MRGATCIWLWMVFLLAPLCTYGQQSTLSVAQRRVGQLRRGINTSGWFAQVYDPKGYTKEHFQSWTTADDIALIKSMGFDHVRLSVNPAPMFNATKPGEINPEYLASVDAAAKMILDHGLAVIIDIHPDSDFKAQLKDDLFVQKFADFWRAFAHHYSTWDGERVFLEIMNEPEMADQYRWYGIEAKLAAAIREGAPGHTIIATGAKWSNDDELVMLEPLRDPNVIYNFHFYFPHVFTHQGATWGSYYWQWVKGLGYPSNAGVGAAHGIWSAGCAGPPGGDSLRVRALGCGTDRCGDQSGGGVGAEERRAADLQRVRSLS